MSSPTSIALSYDLNHQLIYQEEGSNQLKHVFIPKTTLENAPLALSKKFVQAFLANNDKSVLKFTSFDLLRGLRQTDIETKAQDSLSNLANYQENIYMYGKKAEVIATKQTPQGEVIVSFDFVWQNGQWLLVMVW